MGNTNERKRRGNSKELYEERPSLIHHLSLVPTAISSTQCYLTFAKLVNTFNDWENMRNMRNEITKGIYNDQQVIFHFVIFTSIKLYLQTFLIFIPG